MSNIQAYTAVASTITAILSSFCAIISVNLARKIYQEAKDDEKLIASDFKKPGLRQPEHDSSVITCNLFNLSKRKMYIESITMKEGNEEKRISWSSSIDDFGNPTRANHMFGIENNGYLFIRKKDGNRIVNCEIKIYHSFSKTPIVKHYNELNAT